MEMKKIRSLYIAGILLIFLFCLAYWFKCQLGIDFIRSFHLGNYLPIGFLQNSYAANSVVFANKLGDLLDDSFDSPKSSQNWSKIWMREEGKVKQGYDVNGIDKSRALLIESNSEKDWSYQHNKLIKVKEGDTFKFEGNVRTQGKGITVTLSVILYDKDKREIKWHYGREDIGERTEWIKVERQFIVPKGIEYIRFRLTGSGVGQAWFDNVKFKKETTVLTHDKIKQKTRYYLENELVRYTIDLQEGSISAFDKRVNTEWMAHDVLNNFLMESAKTNAYQLELKLKDKEFLHQYKVIIKLFQNLAELE